MDERQLDLQYKFNDIFAEVESGSSQGLAERPVCDSLRCIEQEYKDFEELARGGMKRVYKVMDCKLNRYVAYAKLHPNSPRELHDPFIREARLTALLEHPNIISVHDIGVNDEDTPFFTMELKVGQTLAATIKANPGISRPGTNSFSTLLESFVKVCDAISYAHSKNVLHLDIKPENIQVGEFGEVIVCDWGLAQNFANKINAEMLTGTPLFVGEDVSKEIPRHDDVVIGRVADELHGRVIDIQMGEFDIGIFPGHFLDGLAPES